MAYSFASFLFSEPDEDGILSLCAVGTNDRYNPVTAQELKDQSLYQHIQSVELLGSTQAEGNCILFANDDFTGPFVQLTDAHTAGAIHWDIANSKTSSVLLVAARKKGQQETRLSFSGLFLDQWNTFLDAQLAGTQVSREGNPTLTWAMFPENIPNLDSTQTYLKIYQPLHVSIDYWPDYSASLTYYVFVAAWFGGLFCVGMYADTWVEGGAKHDKVFRKLDPEVQNGLNALEDQMNQEFLALNKTTTITDVYYLPGSQPNDPFVGATNGNTNDDVTIVIVH